MGMFSFSIYKEAGCDGKTDGANYKTILEEKLLEAAKETLNIQLTGSDQNISDL